MAAENFAASARPSLRRGDRGAQGWRPAIMNAAIDRSRIIIGVDPVLVFALRCWARAALVQAGEICLQEAVDVLQADAERDGLIDQLGADCIQGIMAGAFHYPWRSPQRSLPNGRKASTTPGVCS